MGGNTYWNTHGYSRIFNTSWVDQSGAADGDVTDWTVGDAFILVSQVYSNADVCNKDCDGAQFKLQFKNTTDTGSFADVGSGTEISWGSGVVTDDASGSQRLTGDSLSFCGTGYQQAYVNEGDNTLPDSGTLTGATEQWTELQWVLDTDNATSGKQYHFRIVDVTNTVNLARSSGFDADGPGITMAVAPDDCTADNILSGTPVLGSPTAAVIHNLTADNIVTGAPVPASPTIGQEHGLTADNITAGTPVPASPTIGQEHALTANNIATQAPVLGTPTVSEEGADECTADNILSGTPVLGTPSIGQEHGLTADNIAVQNPVLGTPTLGQEHGLTADNISSQASALGTPTIGVIHNLSADSIGSANPVLDSPALGQEHGLTADNIVFQSPVLGTPAIGQIHGLTADNIASQSPVLETPTAGIAHNLTANNILIGQSGDGMFMGIDGNAYIKSGNTIINI